MKKNHRILKVVSIFLLVIIIGGLIFKFTSDYISSLPKLKYVFAEGSKTNPPYPETNFAVMSDLHYYDKSLGTEGKAFEECLASDRKLLLESADVINYAVDDILKSGVKFVLIPGDLTKDGELIDHQQTIKVLGRLKANGIQPYVIPGNHDVNNGNAYRYEGANKVPVQNISAAQFADIYKDFGYGQAIYRHKDSLSYVAEPQNNLWLVCLDSQRYSENKPGQEPITDGRFTQSLETWLEEILSKARQQSKAVMVMVHQGVLEHWNGQDKLHSEYLLDDYKYISEMLASYGVRLAFTGHYHAQDIAKASFDDKGYILDIETGSLVTPPCPLRYCTIDSEQKLRVSSKQLAKTIHPGSDFESKGTKFVYDNIEGIAYQKLRSYFVNEKDAKAIAGNVATAFIAHYNGEDKKENMVVLDESSLTLWSKIVLSTQRYVIDGLWNDTSITSDNNCLIDLSDGKQL